MISRRRRTPPQPPPADLEAADQAVLEAQEERKFVQALTGPVNLLSARLRQQRIENHFAERYESAYRRKHA